MFKASDFKKLLILIVAIITFIALGGTFYFIADIENINYTTLRFSIYVDLFLLAVMIAIVSSQIIRLITQNREKSKLRNKVILMFLFLSIVPTLAVTAFSSLFFNYGVKSWFDKRVSQALENSVTVAEAYLKEHANNLSVEALSLAREISGNNLYDVNKLNEIMNAQSYLKDLTEAVILKDNTILAKSKLSFSINFDRIPIQFLQEANLGEIVVFTSNKEDRVRALIKIGGHESIYLLISKLIDRKVIKHVTSTKVAVHSYLSLQKTINSIQLQFFLLFILVSLLLIMFSIWCAVHFSNGLLYPIIELAHATKKITSGDLGIVVIPNDKKDEISDLATSFNNMTETLSKQRKELIATNEDLSERHIFIRTILADLSSGVIVLDMHRRITLLNNVAYKLLDINEEIIGKNLFLIIPEIENILDSCKHGGHIEEKIESIKNNEIMHLLIRASPINYHKTSIDGYIVTFDDISKMVSAQKALTWSEVAKRIAHEIKNPITPIYLATERLEKHLGDENKNIVKYLNIIKRNIDQVSSIINEFAHFARLPNPIFVESDMQKIMKSSIASMEVVFNEVKYNYLCSTRNFLIKCDAKQIGCVFDNIIRNACEAMISTANPSIDINITDKLKYINISIEDNGPGFPKEIINALTEPYVTTKASGTGLGLAIAKKIIDEHNGKLEFSISSKGGGKVVIQIPFFLV